MIVEGDTRCYVSAMAQGPVATYQSGETPSTTKDCANATISCQTHDDYLPISAFLNVQASGNSQPRDFEGNGTKIDWRKVRSY